MKKLLLLLLLTSTSTVFAQNTFIPDDNFEQALIDLGYDSGPLDDNVLTANINSITFLDISNRGIKDLTGVEAMLSLEVLRCNNNILTDVDFSSNTALRGLVISINPLTGLDLSANTVLENLICAGNNLSNLDLSSNNNLERLSCAGNNLETLALSENKALIELNCSGNNLTSLDLSLHSALAELNCSNNNLYSLDIKNGNNGSLTMLALNNPNLLCIKH